MSTLQAGESEPNGLERAQAKRFAEKHGLPPDACEELAHRFADYAAWLKHDWQRSEKARHR